MNCAGDNSSSLASAEVIGVANASHGSGAIGRGILGEAVVGSGADVGAEGGAGLKGLVVDWEAADGGEVLDIPEF